MQNEQTPYGTTTQSPTAKSEAEARQAWEAFQRDLDVLGRQLAELGTHGAALGEHVLSSLQAHFQEVKDRATSYKAATEQEIETARRTAQAEAESTIADVKARSTEAAKQMWEKAQPLREGAKDVGEGLFRAWTELRASFGKAAQRLQEEKQAAANGTVPVPTEDRRETT
jgi:hypothetical protein